MWRAICALRNVSDFKTVTSYRLIGKDQYELVAPGGEIKHGTLGNETYSNKADTYGLMLSIDRRDIINDDMSAITTVPRKLGRGSGTKINDVFWKTFLDNAAFFTAPRANYLSGATTALGIDGLTAGEVAFLDQVDGDGKPIGIMPAILLVPTALSAIASQLFKSLELRDTTANAKFPVANPHQGKFRVEVSRYLANAQYTGNSAKAWYLLADPNDLPVIEVAFLNGQESPHHRNDRRRLQGTRRADARLPRLRRGPAGLPRRREGQGRSLILFGSRSMPQASYVDEGEAIDFTPVAAVAAGDVVVQGTLVGMARTALAAGRSGSLAVRGLFDVVKGATTFAAGWAVYWNPTGLPLGGTVANGAAVPSSTGILLGYSVRAANANDRTVRVAVVLPALPGPQGIPGNTGPVGPAGPQGDPGPTGRPAGIQYQYIGDSDGPGPGQFCWSNSSGAYLFPVTDLEGNDQSPVWFALNQTTDGHFLFLTPEVGGPIKRLDFPAASYGGSVFYLYVGNQSLTPGIYYAVPVIRALNGAAGPEGPSWIPSPPGSGTWFLEAVNGALQWVEEPSLSS